MSSSLQKILNVDLITFLAVPLTLRTVLSSLRKLIYRGMCNCNTHTISFLHDTLRLFSLSPVIVHRGRNSLILLFSSYPVALHISLAHCLASVSRTLCSSFRFLLPRAFLSSISLELASELNTCNPLEWTYIQLFCG